MPTHRPLPPQIEQFLHDNPQGVLTSFRRNGMPQLSIVTVYPRDGGVGVSITETRAKFKNLLRDPRCSVLVSHADWWSGFLVFEGRAELLHSGNADPEELRLARRHISAPPRAGAARTGISTIGLPRPTSASRWWCGPSTSTARPWLGCGRR